MKPLIGITMGDPAGVGPELLVRFARKIQSFNKADFVVFGDYSYLQKTAVKLKISSFPFFPIHFTGHFKKDLSRRTHKAIPVFDLGNLEGRAVHFGQSSAWGGRASGEFVDLAVQAALQDYIDAIVTLPINKKSFFDGGWGKKFPDHTQMLAALTQSPRTVLMMVHKAFRVVHVTQHIPLSRVAAALTLKAVKETILLAHQGLIKMGVRNPRLAVCGLNPHAGDGGVLGGEENRIISPVVKQLRKKGLRLTGPLSADIVWPLVQAGEFDAGIAMYHDQGQIPVKLLAYKSRNHKLDPGGVNVTLGLPFIRTSVAHGTAYDIAGKGEISGRSFFEAIDLAIQMLKRKRSS